MLFNEPVNNFCIAWQHTGGADEFVFKLHQLSFVGVVNVDLFEYDGGFVLHVYIVTLRPPKVKCYFTFFSK
jgi:hypothetical protein